MKTQMTRTRRKHKCLSERESDYESEHEHEDLPELQIKADNRRRDGWVVWQGTLRLGKGKSAHNKQHQQENNQYNITTLIIFLS